MEENFWNILAWTIKKLPLERGLGGRVGFESPCPQIKSFSFPKIPSIRRIALLFSRNSLLFPRVALFFPKVLILSQKCLFISQKCPIVFQNCPYVFQNCFLFIPVRVFSSFPADLTFSSSCPELVRERFSLLLLSFHLELQLMIPSWKPQNICIEYDFYVFYSNFSLLDSLQNAAFEHLQWLSFQIFSRGFAPKLPLRGLQHSTPKTLLLYRGLPTTVP